MTHQLNHVFPEMFFSISVFSVNSEISVFSVLNLFVTHATNSRRSRR